MSRRAMLRLLAGSAAVAAGAGGLAGCKAAEEKAGTPSGPLAGSVTSKTSPPSNFAVIADGAADSEGSLIAAYDDAIAARPDLAAALTPLRANHVRHLDGLRPGAPLPPASASLRSPGSDSAAPSGASAPPSTPGSSQSPTPPAVLGHLADLEKAAAAARVNDALASGGSLARLLASIGGCEASHEATLRALR